MMVPGRLVPLLPLWMMCALGVACTRTTLMRLWSVTYTHSMSSGGGEICHAQGPGSGGGSVAGGGWGFQVRYILSLR